MTASGPSERVVVVPASALSEVALEGLVDAFVLREGTDYGHADYTLEQKRADVLARIERGEVVIVFDGERESANLIVARDLPDALRE